MQGTPTGVEGRGAWFTQGTERKQARA